MPHLVILQVNIGEMAFGETVTVTRSRCVHFNWASVFLFKQNEAPERKDDEDEDEEQTTK